MSASWARRLVTTELGDMERNRGLGCSLKLNWGTTQYQWVPRELLGSLDQLQSEGANGPPPSVDPLMRRPQDMRIAHRLKEIIFNPFLAPNTQWGTMFVAQKDESPKIGSFHLKTGKWCIF